MEKRLTLSSTDKKIAGVCGGLAEYLNVDPTLVRVVFIALAVAGGPGLLLYLLLWMVIPAENEEKIKRY
jgi:phage shock protein C